MATKKETKKEAKIQSPKTKECQNECVGDLDLEKAVGGRKPGIKVGCCVAKKVVY